MKKILIVAANYMDLKISSNNRTNFLPQFLYNQGYDVEVVTSDFNHHRKEHVHEIELRDYTFTVLHERGYSKNVSFMRLLSIYTYKRNLKKYLSKKSQVDVVYSFVPPHSVAQIAKKYAKRVNAKFIIDVRDLWPEAFRLVVKNKFLYSILFFPLILQANITYKMADEVVAVSNTYLNRALKVNKRVNKGYTVYLGTNLEEFDKYTFIDYSIIKPPYEIWVVYTGTLGNSYDLTTVFKAYKILMNEKNTNIKLHILGNGPLENQFHLLAEQLEIDVKFHGRLPYPEMVSFLAKCDIVLNPLVKGAAQSIINKHADYAASGLPIVSTQITKEYVNLIKNRNMGFNVKVEDYVDFADKILVLAKDESLRKKMGINHRKFAEQKMNRNKIYDQLLDIM